LDDVFGFDCPVKYQVEEGVLPMFRPLALTTKIAIAALILSLGWLLGVDAETTSLDKAYCQHVQPMAELGLVLEKIDCERQEMLLASTEPDQTKVVQHLSEIADLDTLVNRHLKARIGIADSITEQRKFDALTTAWSARAPFRKSEPARSRAAT
jgi:hypothetical protein